MKWNFRFQFDISFVQVKQLVHHTSPNKQKLSKEKKLNTLSDLSKTNLSLGTNTAKRLLSALPLTTIFWGFVMTFIYLWIAHNWDLESKSKTNFKAEKLLYSEIMHSDWLKLVTWRATSNQSALFKVDKLIYAEKLPIHRQVQTCDWSYAYIAIGSYGRVLKHT